MGNFAEAGKIKDEMKKRDATRREKLAGYFFDLSKLIFAGMVIGLIYHCYLILKTPKCG